VGREGGNDFFGRFGVWSGNPNPVGLLEGGAWEGGFVLLWVVGLWAFEAALWLGERGERFV